MSRKDDCVESKKIFATAPVHIPIKASVGEPSFLTNTERLVLIRAGMEKAEYQNKYCRAISRISALEFFAPLKSTICCENTMPSRPMRTMFLAI